MKTKDIVLAGLITINLALLVLVAAVTAFGPAAAGASLMSPERPAVAGPVTDDVGYFRVCTVRVAESREALAVIDTVTDRLNFYLNEQGRTEFKPIGPYVDLAQLFQHPTWRKP